MVIEKSKDYYGAYSENCDGIYAAGKNVEAVKADTFEAIRLIKNNLPKTDGLNQSKEIMKSSGIYRIPKEIDGYYSITTFCVMPSKEMKYTP